MFKLLKVLQKLPSAACATVGSLLWCDLSALSCSGKPRINGTEGLSFDQFSRHRGEAADGKLQVTG